MFVVFGALKEIIFHSLQSLSVVKTKKCWFNISSFVFVPLLFSLLAIFLGHLRGKELPIMEKSNK